jgi:hypothetical protein
VNKTKRATTRGGQRACNKEGTGKRTSGIFFENYLFDEMLVCVGCAPPPKMSDPACDEPPGGQ